ncbi:MAG: hypothetical protein A2887_06795 [Alphaproteobacteria bacterium RIFCSPLOWO2_01_FULL_40_26]|nr:MAG: hypothetical protein A3D15_06485 [Alphaproteobacteria bacterium RIFCSPHIGHO2_02_FULL_40_34]OFW87690.1 MAG: hypothetical protein A2794_01215 [Alphaproteobacteria bacterium RIFCSPHIGHO2_01_FULL_40_8]OFW95413.1 MAG: hypothetical protein A2887_06795 [Alphaproteobacteria bacterium RIFCSPLOWO2_01_FULL_40_26]OFX10052.1 MAG: hypothetical protein A3H30_04510 [Alphaproteobacteria bacterium RIFCSPLOWO2_02_FULL_40_19]OFX11686.1 MAG: hypothetical protein A3G22_04105 [Alphaproteobacteria bacterium RI
MISADTSVMVAYFQGLKGDDITIVEEALLGQRLILAPMVISELLSDPSLSTQLIKNITALPIMEIGYGYWHRAGFTRAKILSKKLKARSVDVQIAQLCIDHEIPIVTRDKDFRHLEKHCGLKIIKI